MGLQIGLILGCIPYTHPYTFPAKNCTNSRLRRRA